MGDFPSSGSGTTGPFLWLEQILFFLHCDKRVEDDKTINISPSVEEFPPSCSGDWNYGDFFPKLPGKNQV